MKRHGVSRSTSIPRSMLRAIHVAVEQSEYVTIVRVVMVDTSRCRAICSAVAGKNSSAANSMLPDSS